MPLRTPYYNLEAFLWGEIYSAAADRRRITTIDSQLGFLSDMIGPGRISGWQVSVKELSSRTLTISTGMGIIGRKVLFSFGNFDFQLAETTTEYVYMREKLNQVGGFSNFSNITSFIQSDGNPPSKPTGLQSISSLITYNEISFEWTANTEPDFSHYIIKRSSDEVYGGFETIASNVTDISYLDTKLEQDTEYTYHIIAVDFSGNESEPAIINIFTLVDTRPPIPPLFFQLFPGDEEIQAIWDDSPSDNADIYSLIVREAGSTNVISTHKTGKHDFDSTFLVIDSLINNTEYEVVLTVISESGIVSEELIKTAKPVLKLGAGEVDDVQIIFSESQFEEVGIEADVSWKFPSDEDPYLGIPEFFQISFIENGNRTSETIEILFSTNPNIIKYTTKIRFLPFKDNNDKVVFESFKEYTPYVMVIQTVDSDGEVSNGIIKRINRTPTFELLPAVTDVKIIRNIDDSVSAVWKNPFSQFFDYNLIIIRVVDLGTGDSEVVVEDVNIGLTSTYTVPSKFFGKNKRYKFSFTPVDIFGREGASSTHRIQFLDTDVQDKPDSPSNVRISSSDGTITLKWDINFGEINNVVSYRIYRAVNQIFIIPENFTLLGTIPANNDFFVDFTAKKGTTYAYFVTAIDIFGNESLNPIGDGFTPGLLSVASVNESSSLVAPTGLTISRIPFFDAQLAWDSDVSQFDGYEIFRSVGNNYSFVLVGSALSTENSFVDKNAFLKNGEEYFYIIRKYRNEVEPFVTTSLVPPSNSIVLASVKTFLKGSSQKIVIDNTLATELENFEEPIREKTKEELALHQHILEGSLDKRIELRANALITNWTTIDFKVYSTEDDISGSSDFIVRISATINEDFFTDSNGTKDVVSVRQAQAGISPILFKINASTGTITFRDPIFTTCVEPVPDPLNPDAPSICPFVPYSTEPVLTLELVDLSEVDGELPQDKIESISATQITSGEILKDQLPDIVHEGRIKERLLPLLVPMASIDNYVYELSNIFEDNDRNKVGSSVTFYDILQLDSANNLLAATSNGIWFSSDFGNTWNKRASFDVPTTRLFRSSVDDYFVLTNYGVYRSKSSNFASWELLDGLEFVKVIRDITEDILGNLFISTDLGVFRLNKDKPFIEDTWEQLNIFNATSTDAYGIFYDPARGSIFSGNDLGIVQSTDEGKSWVYDASLPANTKVQKFIKIDKYIFALTNNKLYRIHDEETVFTEIADFDTELARHMVVLNDVLYITTNKGPLFSGVVNIYSDVDIDFLPVFSKINIGQNIVVVTSLNRIDNKVLVGTDRRLFLLDSDNVFWLQYEQSGTTVPTIYVDKEERNLGVFYNNAGSKQNISFDDNLLPDNVVTIANKYNIYIAEFGGWSEQKFDATAKVRVNNISLGETTGNVFIDKSNFTNFEFPVFDDTNAHEEKALLFKANVEKNIQSISDSSGLENNVVRDLITETFKNIEMFLSQLYSEARFLANGDPVKLPDIIIKLVKKKDAIDSFGQVVIEEIDLNATVNATTGAFVFSLSFDKFDKLEVDILGVTLKNIGELIHGELEDTMEFANSGLPASLSQVQHVNLVKLGIFNEKQWPGQQSLLMSPALQAEYIIPRGENWYDTLNSTINYKREINKDNINLRLSYVNSALYIEETDIVYAVGDGGVLSINASTLEIDEVNVSSTISNQIVRDVERNGDEIYILTNKNIYLSVNFGDTWELFDKAGLPNNLHSISFVLNNIVVGAENGIYYKASPSVNWDKAFDSTSPVDIMINPDLMFVVVDNNIYISGDGFSFFKLETNHEFLINDMEKYGTAIYLATNEGLYTDTNTFYGNSPRVTFIDVESEDRIINDLDANIDVMSIALNTSKYYVQEGDSFLINDVPSLSSVQTVLLVNNDVWLFGYDKLAISSLISPIVLSSGVPG